MSGSSDDAKKQLYNRQEYVVGAETQAKYGQTTVLVVGTTGAGAEIIKNLVLTGVRAVLIHDPHPAQIRDLGTNFFLQPGDVGKARGAVVAARAQELNRYVEVSDVSSAAADAAELLDRAQVVVYSDALTASLVEADRRARVLGVKLVAVESRGVAGSVFVDAGTDFEIVDTDGEPTVMCVVTGVSDDGLVTLHDDKSHECEVGSQVYLTGLAAPAALNSVTDPSGKQPPQLRLFEVAEVVSPYILRLKGFKEALAGASAALGPGTYLHTTKRRVRVPFLPLEESLRAPEFALIFDSEAKMEAPATLHAVFRAVAAAGAIPHFEADVQKVVKAAAALHPGLDVSFAEKVLRVFEGSLNPLACFLGGVAAQEVLKVCSGKFTPIHQWLYYDARELLDACDGAGSAVSLPPANRYGSQSAVIGEGLQHYLRQQKVFIVGAGALGCELIKNVALMGFGAVSITDMDTIEMSNLSRQFLFRPSHIGRPKSTVAAEAARAINGELAIKSYEEKMGDETEGIFNEHFWTAHAVVLNALDNVASRKYVDGRCVFYQRPLFESGTLGTKCNAQPVIPFVTESYGSSYDPPEKSIPLCTLKNFPSAIEHTIEWARDQFHLLFTSTAEDVNAYLKDPAEFKARLEGQPAAAAIAVRNVREALSNWPRTPEDCARRARLLYHQSFNESLRQLLFNLPLDKRNESGELFWSGAKKPPVPQDFKTTEPRDVDYVYHCAALLARVYGVADFNLTPEAAAAAAAAVAVPDFVPQVTTYATSEKETKDPAAPAAPPSDDDVASLPPPSQFAGRTMHPESFEKDDLSNHHVQFITACSNLRAAAYSIPPADLNETKRIAGKIIPAMVTTTALVTGLVGLEALKYLALQYRQQQKHGRAGLPPPPADIPKLLSFYRSAFVNIALPFFAFSDPIIAAGNTYTLPESGRSVRWGLWDRLDVNEGRDLTVQELVDLLEARYEMEIFMIALTSGKMIFSSFGGKAADKAKPVSALAFERGETQKEGSDYLDLVISGTIGDVDPEIPVLRYKYRNF